MNEIKTEEQFKESLMHCTRFMTKNGSESVEMDIGKVTIKLSLKIKSNDKREEKNGI